LAVSNVGAGSLSGDAHFLAGSSAEFSLVSGGSYVDLHPGDAAVNILVRFSPTTTGTKSAQILFDVLGGRVGAQIVTLTGVGGIAQIAVTPTTINIPAVAVGDDGSASVTVKDTGDGILVGRAQLATPSDFALSQSAAGALLSRIDYQLDPGQGLTFFVHFRPSRTGIQTETLTLSGGGGASVSLTGSTP
jgi:hypothetical protein